MDPRSGRDHGIVLCVGLAPGSMREAAHTLRNRAVVAGPLRIDLAAHEATIDGAPVRLSLQEFDLLAALASDVDRAWSFAELTARVWRTGYRGDRDPVNSAVKRLRKRLMARPEVEIASVRGVGYRLRVAY